MSLCTDSSPEDGDLEQASVTGCIQDVRCFDDRMCSARVQTERRMKWSELPEGLAALHGNEVALRESLSTDCALFHAPGDPKWNCFHTLDEQKEDYTIRGHSGHPSLQDESRKDNARLEVLARVQPRGRIS